MGVYEIIGEYLKKGKGGILATVVTRLGSAPRDVGAKMFVGEDGKIFGTIGGGKVESDTCKEALSMMKKAETRMLHVRMDYKTIEDEGMLCGGNVDIFLEPVFDRYTELYQRIAYLEKRGRRGVVITKYGAHTFSKTLLEGHGLSIIGDSLMTEEIEKYGQYIYDQKPFVSDGIIIEPVQIASRLYIFGAGHVSQFLAKIANLVDFNVVVIDDREDFANRERFPEADEVIVDDFKNVMNRLTYSGEEYVVILTRGHKHDREVLEETVKKDTRYIGMIGSKRKIKMIFEHLKEKGFPESSLKKVHAPIGIDINAETPQEIAVSIAAELIQVRGAQ
jgi:xanthine dehydrogenase accessory factor